LNTFLPNQTGIANLVTLLREQNHGIGVSEEDILVEVEVYGVSQSSGESLMVYFRCDVPRLTASMKHHRHDLLRSNAITLVIFGIPEHFIHWFQLKVKANDSWSRISSQRDPICDLIVGTYLGEHIGRFESKFRRELGE
jgi:hypothetical protein